MTTNSYPRSWLAPLRAALRPALRELRFHKLRSLAAILLIAVPVALTTYTIAYDSARTAVTDSDFDQTYANYYGGTCEQDTQYGNFECTDDTGDVIARSLPNGKHEDGHRNGDAKILELAESVLPSWTSASAIYYATIVVSADSGEQLRSTYSLIPENVQGLLASHVPAAGEIALPKSDAAMLGVKAGDRITVWAENSPQERKTLTVSELTPLSYAITSQPLSTTHANPTVNQNSAVTLYSTHTMTWDEVKNFNRNGFVVSGKALTNLDVPENEQYEQFANSEVLHEDPSFGTYVAEYISWFTLVLIAAILVLLLISPVFSISASRNTSVFALMRSQGAAKRDIFRAVVFYGLVAGVIGTAIGWIVGMGTALAYWKVSFPNWPFTQSFVSLGVIPVIAILASVIVSMLPAALASRTDIIAGITGATTGKLMRWRKWMWAGPVLIALAVIMFAAVKIMPPQSESVAILLASTYALAPLFALIGLALSAPALAYIAGSLGKPLAMRLAGRELRRNTMRTVPVIAAIAGLVFVSSMFSSGTTNYYRHQSDQLDRVFSQNFGVISEPPDFNPSQSSSDQLAPGVVKDLDENNAENVKRLYSRAINLAREDLGPGTDIVVYSVTSPYSPVYSHVDVHSDYFNACTDGTGFNADSPLFTDASYANRCAYENMMDYLATPSALSESLIADESILEIFHLSESDKQQAQETLRNGGVLAAKHHGSSNSTPVVLEEALYDEQGNDQGTRTTTRDLPVAAVLPDSFPGLILSFGAAKDLEVEAQAASVLLLSGADDRTIAEAGGKIADDNIQQNYFPLKYVPDYMSIAGIPLGAAGIVVAVLGLVIALSLPHIRQTFQQYSAMGASQKTLRRIGSLYTGIMATVAVVPGFLLSVVTASFDYQQRHFAANGVQVASSQSYSMADNWLAAIIFLIGIPILAFIVGWITTPKVGMKYRQD